MEAIEPVRLNAEKGGKADAQHYNVHGYPTILFLDGSGVVQGTIGGFMPPSAFAPAVDRNVAAWRDTPTLEADLKAHPTDRKTLLRLADIYALKQQVAKTEEMLRRFDAAPASGRMPALSAVYNNVGDMYQAANRNPDALRMYRAGLAAAQTPLDVANSRLNIGEALLQTGNKTGAAAQLKMVIDAAGVPPDMQDMARLLLGFIH